MSWGDAGFAVGVHLSSPTNWEFAYGASEKKLERPLG